MEDLLWFSDIHWNTPLSDIGWTYVLMLALGAIATHAIKQAIRPRKR